MENKLQELTQKLYNEGVEKANQEASQILNEANAEAEKVKQAAKKDAEKIIAEADQKAAETKKNVESELNLAAKQTVRKLKQEVADLIIAKVVDAPVKDSFNDAKFVMQLIETAVKNWDADKNEAIDLAVLLPEKLEKEFESYFKSKTAKELKAGLELSVSDTMKGGFKIGPADGSYIISFSEDDFENFFKSYLRPKTTEILYKGE